MTEFSFTEQKVVSLRHKITENIRKAIFEGKLKPGDRIREVKIAKQMGISRGPLREALLVLEQEGLLISQPYKETVVAEFSKKEVIEVLIPIRQTIELFAIRKGLPEITNEDILQLEMIVQNMKEGVEQENFMKVVDSDLAFHEYLVKMSNFTNLINIWASIFNPIRLHFILQTQIYENLPGIWAQHHEVLKAIKEKDVEKTCRILSEHITEANLEHLTMPFVQEEKATSS